MWTIYGKFFSILLNFLWSLFVYFIYFSNFYWLFNLFIFQISIGFLTFFCREQSPILGGCCFVTSLYMLWPQCFGLYGNMTVGCFELEYKACKISARPTDWCILLNLGCLFVAPKTCLKSVCQCCCIDGRCAIPCHTEMPCLINVCGVNCVYQYACSCHCCKSIGYLAEIRELEEQNKERSEKN